MYFPYLPRHAICGFPLESLKLATCPPERSMEASARDRHMASVSGVSGSSWLRLQPGENLQLISSLFNTGENLPGILYIESIIYVQRKTNNSGPFLENS